MTEVLTNQIANYIKGLDAHIALGSVTLSSDIDSPQISESWNEETNTTTFSFAFPEYIKRGEAIEIITTALLPYAKSEDVTSAINSLSENVSNDINSLSENFSNEINALQTALRGEMDKLVTKEELIRENEENTANIERIETDIREKNEEYYNKFALKEEIPSTEGLVDIDTLTNTLLTYATKAWVEQKLSEIPQGGGGVSSWNDLTDKPVGLIPIKPEGGWDAYYGTPKQLDIREGNIAGDNIPTVNFNFKVIKNGVELLYHRYYSALSWDAYAIMKSLWESKINSNTDNLQTWVNEQLANLPTGGVTIEDVNNLLTEYLSRNEYIQDTEVIATALRLHEDKIKELTELINNLPTGGGGDISREDYESLEKAVNFAIVDLYKKIADTKESVMNEVNSRLYSVEITLQEKASLEKVESIEKTSAYLFGKIFDTLDGVEELLDTI